MEITLIIIECGLWFNNCIGRRNHLIFFVIIAASFMYVHDVFELIDWGRDVS